MRNANPAKLTDLTLAGGTITLEQDLEDSKLEGVISELSIVGQNVHVRCSRIEKVGGNGHFGESPLEFDISLELVSDSRLERTELYLSTVPIIWESFTVRCSEEIAAEVEPITQPPLLAQDRVASYVGGDLEVHVGTGGITDTWRGPVTTISVVDDVLAITCGWMGFLPKGSVQWRKDNKTEYRWNLGDFQIRSDDALDRIILAHKEGPAKGLIVLNPHGRNLDPAKVEGLVL